MKNLLFNPEKRLDRAKFYLQSTEKISWDNADVKCSLAVLSLLSGDFEESKRYWKKAYTIDPKMTKYKIKNPRVGELFKRYGIDNPFAVIRKET